jgi:regulator of replication initiation timing
MTFITSGLQSQLRNVNLFYPKSMKMKNQYEIKETLLLKLENDELKERIKELKIKILELETKLKQFS